MRLLCPFHLGSVPEHGVILEGATELLLYFCFLDFVTTRASGQVLLRTSTLAEGGEKCNFRFRSARDDEEWPLPFPGDQ